MLRNYFITAVRHLLRNRLYSLINIMGLAIGVAACLLIFLFVRYETSYDNWMPNAENIYRVNYVNFIVGSEDYTCGCTPGIAKGVFDERFSEIAASTRLYNYFPVIKQGNRSFKEEVWMTDQSFFDVFNLRFVEGNKNTAFNNLSSVVISHRIAKKYFGEDSPLGEVLTYSQIGDKRDYKIVGVFEDIPENSEFNFDIIYPFDIALYQENVSVNSSWYYTWGYYYLRLKDGETPANINSQLSELIATNAPPWDERASNETIALTLTNLRDIHLYSSEHSSGSMTGIKPLGNIAQIYTFSVVAFLILLIACVNFMNLSTARSLHRAKEVGLRKVVGARRGQLIQQFLGENIVIATFGLLVALVLVDLTLPFLNALLGLSLVAQYTNDPVLITAGISLLLFIGIIGGLYPALYLSAFRPIDTLSGVTVGGGVNADTFRGALTIFQFAISIALIIATVVVYGQNLFSLTKDLGYSKEHKLVLHQLWDGYVGENKTAITEEIKRLPDVKAVSYSVAIPTDDIGWRFDFKMLGAADSDKQEISPLSVDAHFFELYEIPLVSGRYFDESHPKDFIKLGTKLFPDDEDDGETVFASAILNESAMRLLGFASPENLVGEVIETKGFELDGGYELEVVGVVRDYNFNSLKSPIQPFVYWSHPNVFNNLTIKYHAEADTQKLLSDINAIWRKFVPAVEMASSFVEDRVSTQYDAEIKQSKMLLAFSVLAIIVACLGLYGLAAFTAEQRTKEIAIRKVHGADVWDVVKMLLLQFSKPVLISNLIAWPIAWYFMTDYLNGFTFRIDLNPAYFIGTGMVALIIAWATTTHHALKAARTSPAVVLKGG